MVARTMAIDWRVQVCRVHEGTKLKGRPPWSIDDRNFLTLALCGEAGELANLIKKDWRGDGGDRAPEQAGELADCRIYLQLLAGACKVTLPDDKDVKILKTPACVERRHYHAMQLQTRCGLLAFHAEMNWSLEWRRIAGRQLMLDVQRALVTLADYLSVDLDQACRDTLPKLWTRWPDTAPPGFVPPNAIACADCGRIVFAWHMCDRDDAEGRCWPCFQKTPCGKGEHGEGCQTSVFSDGRRPIVQKGDGS